MRRNLQCRIFSCTLFAENDGRYAHETDFLRSVVRSGAAADGLRAKDGGTGRSCGRPRRRGGAAVSGHRAGGRRRHACGRQSHGRADRAGGGAALGRRTHGRARGRGRPGHAPGDGDGVLGCARGGADGRGRALRGLPRRRAAVPHAAVRGRCGHRHAHARRLARRGVFRELHRYVCRHVPDARRRAADVCL